jgi:2-polyprenyl-3-methyl-5-hydroxy-6-metoxy-1,4-benzoquinol methylase
MPQHLEAPAARRTLPSPEAIHAEVRRRVSAVYAAPPFEDVFRCEGDLLAWHDVLALAQPPTVPGRLSRLKAAFKIKLARALHWLFLRQVKFNHAVAVHACESARVAAALDGNVLELFTAVKALQRDVDALQERLRRSDARVAELEAAVTIMRLRNERATPAADKPAAVDAFALHDHLQGPRGDVMQRLRVYLDYFADAGKVLDIACGRGELIELLEAEGVPACGVDADVDMVDYCQSRGLPVTRAEAADYLNEQPDGSLGGVFLGRSVERMVPAVLVGLLRLCRSKVRPGGVIVVEAVNPTCPEALATFSEDSSRLRPLPPDLLCFLLQSEGITVTETLVNGPAEADWPPVARCREGLPPQAAGYRTYAVMGRV